MRIIVNYHQLLSKNFQCCLHTAPGINFTSQTVLSKCFQGLVNGAVNFIICQLTSADLKSTVKSTKQQHRILYFCIVCYQSTFTVQQNTANYFILKNLRTTLGWANAILQSFSVSTTNEYMPISFLPQNMSRNHLCYF